MSVSSGLCLGSGWGPPPAGPTDPAGLCPPHSVLPRCPLPLTMRYVLIWAFCSLVMGPAAKTNSTKSLSPGVIAGEGITPSVQIPSVSKLGVAKCSDLIGVIAGGWDGFVL